VLDHKTDGIYRSVAVAITETVSNAWDVAATEVRIDLDISGDRIEIVDNGIGMDLDAINERYLRVGYRRRRDGDTTPGGRSVMGRKGIGKLSLFSIADLIEIKTQANGAEPAGLKIISSDLRRAMETDLSVYIPEPVAVSQRYLSRQLSHFPMRP